MSLTQMRPSNSRPEPIVGPSGPVCVWFSITYIQKQRLTFVCLLEAKHQCVYRTDVLPFLRKQTIWTTEYEFWFEKNLNETKPEPNCPHCWEHFFGHLVCLGDCLLETFRKLLNGTGTENSTDFSNDYYSRHNRSRTTSLWNQLEELRWKL